MREIFRKLHSWSSLVIGVFLVIICLTGSLLVFKPEINKALYPEMYKVTGDQLISYDQAYAEIQKAYPEASIYWIGTPNDVTHKGIYSFWIADQDVWMLIHMDPGTGEILGDIESVASFTHLLKQIHRDLLLSDYHGFEIVSVLGLIMAFILLSGFYLWWPGITKFFKRLKIRKGKGPFVLNYDLHNDLHNLFGVLFLSILLVVAITGGLFKFGNPLFELVGSKARFEPPKEVKVVASSEGEWLSLDKLSKIAEAEIPNSKVTWFEFPGKQEDGEAEGAMKMSLIAGYDPTKYGRINIWVDQYSGKVNYIEDPRNQSGMLYDTWNRPLHIGSFGGPIVEILYAIAGIVPSVLMGTGVYMWVVKRKRRKLSKKQNTEEVLLG